MTHAEIMEYLTRLEQAIKDYDHFKAQAIVKEFRDRISKYRRNRSKTDQ